MSDLISRLYRFLKRKIIQYFVNLYYRAKNFNSTSKPKLLIYTDSRGFFVGSSLSDKTPYKSYIEKLYLHYRVSSHICPHKHTTILDFLNDTKNFDYSSYSNIVIHLGIVDWSPRPLSQINFVYNTKRKLSNKAFNWSLNANFYEEKYEGYKTFIMYSEEDLENLIIPKLNQIATQTNLIFIGINKIDLSWDGNYSRGRPVNISHLTSKYQKLFIKNISKNVKLLLFDESFNVKENTIDNIHFNEKGFEYVFNKLEKLLKK